ncbi:MAG TPA: thioredoxin domain-containing protein [Rhizomicrobium sp.]|nr:thioredoxin domain-containing protein [Rhizomicrobium sp.]
MKRNLLIAGLIALGLAASVTLVACNQSSSGSGGTAASADRIELTNDDRAMGDPKAPIQFVEYAAPSCPHCAHFNETVFPFIKKNYIDTGKVYYVFRVFPIGAQDIPAEALARCFPKESYFAFIDLLFKQQQIWDPEYGITNVQAGLVEVANIAGMPQDKAIACMGNQAEAQRVNKSAQEAIAKFNLNSTPSFVVNGSLRQVAADPESMKKLLDGLLAKK